MFWFDWLLDLFVMGLLGMAEVVYYLLSWFSGVLDFGWHCCLGSLLGLVWIGCFCFILGTLVFWWLFRVTCRVVC